MRRIFSLILLSLLAFEAIGLLWNIFVKLDIISPSNELPLANIQGIVVSDNRILIGLGDYDVIQEFDLSGSHVKNWGINSLNRGFHFWIDEHGKPKSENRWSTGKLKKHLTTQYFRNAKLDSMQLISLSNQWNEPELYADQNGVKYEIRNPIFRQLTRTANSETVVVFSQGLINNMWCGLTRTWLYCVVIWFSFLFVNIIPLTKHVMNGESFSPKSGWKEIWRK